MPTVSTVSKNKKGLFVARPNLAGKKYHLGVYQNEIAAELAVIEFKLSQELLTLEELHKTAQAIGNSHALTKSNEISAWIPRAEKIHLKGIAKIQKRVLESETRAKSYQKTLDELKQIAAITDTNLKRINQRTPRK